MSNPAIKTYEIRFRVPWTDNEQYVYGFKFVVRKADSAEAAKATLPFNSFDIHITQVPA